MTKTTLQFSPIGRTIFSPAAGYNFRIRDNDGEFYSIKPSTRPRGVKGEYGFETFNPNKPNTTLGVEIPVGEWGLEPLKYGWLKLVPTSEVRPLMVTSVQEAVQEATAPEVEMDSASVTEVIEAVAEVVETVADAENPEATEETPRERRNRLRRERRRAAKEQDRVADAA